jgi:ubiquinone/menaquinone biosynthesis C-methylase UbiE
MLLKRLNENGTPTFHDYGAEPPMHVLDLGCGQGTWVIEAATAWQYAGTTVTGFDLVDLVGKSAKVPENVSWRRGNL